jgi:hypothetical protein
MEEEIVVGEKVVRFQGKDRDPGYIAGHIEQYLKDDGFTVQTSKPSPQGVVIQAKKDGFLREVVDADRAMTIAVAGNPNDFTVRIGIGKWAEHLGVAVIETLLLSELFLPVDVAESAWTIEIEDKLVTNLKAFVG